MDIQLYYFIAQAQSALTLLSVLEMMTRFSRIGFLLASTIILVDGQKPKGNSATSGSQKKRHRATTAFIPNEVNTQEDLSPSSQHGSPPQVPTDLDQHPTIPRQTPVTKAKNESRSGKKNKNGGVRGIQVSNTFYFA